MVSIDDDFYPTLRIISKLTYKWMEVFQQAFKNF